MVNEIGDQQPPTTHADVTSTNLLSLGDIPIARGVILSDSQVSDTPTIQWKKQNLTLAVGAFFGMMFLWGLGFAAFSQCSVPTKIVRTLLTIPGTLGASLLFYWYVPVRQSIGADKLASDKTATDCSGWSWSATPQSRLLFVCSREKINDGCAQLVLNGRSKRYAGIVFPNRLVVPLKQTVSVVAKFDDNGPLEDPWIRSKDGGGIYAPWSMKDFIEAAEASKDFGVTFKDKAGVFYTFTFDIRKLQSVLGPDRKYFIGGK